MNKSSLSVLAACFLIQTFVSGSSTAAANPIGAAAGAHQSYVAKGPLRDVTDGSYVRRGGVWRHRH